MNYALIFAGGTGQRMNSKTTPKQFLELHGKPIIIYTLEQFQNHSQIDGIVVVCLEGWIPALEGMLHKFHITKVKAIVPGGSTGQESIFFGVKKLRQICPNDTIVLVHDGVRPLIDKETISEAIKCTQKYGNAITVTQATETVVYIEETQVSDMIGDIINRQKCRMARAPQCFYLDALYQAHQKARETEKNDFVDSACLMQYYGAELHAIEGPVENIKITTPMDFYLFRAICDAKEDKQIIGL